MRQHQRRRTAAYNRSLRNRGAFVAAVIFWVLHLFSLLALATCVWFFVEYQNDLAMKVLLTSLALAVFTWILAFFRRKSALCLMCKGTPLWHSGAIPHQKSFRLPPFNLAVSTLLGIVFTQRFTCMYCGARYDMLKSPKKPGSHSREKS